MQGGTAAVTRRLVWLPGSTQGTPLEAADDADRGRGQHGTLWLRPQRRDQRLQANMHHRGCDQAWCVSAVARAGRAVVSARVNAGGGRTTHVASMWVLAMWLVAVLGGLCSSPCYHSSCAKRSAVVRQRRVSHVRRRHTVEWRRHHTERPRGLRRRPRRGWQPCPCSRPGIGGWQRRRAHRRRQSPTTQTLHAALSTAITADGVLPGPAHRCGGRWWRRGHPLAAGAFPDQARTARWRVCGDDRRRVGILTGSRFVWRRFTGRRTQCCDRCGRSLRRRGFLGCQLRCSLGSPPGAALGCTRHLFSDGVRPCGSRRLRR